LGQDFLRSKQRIDRLARGRISAYRERDGDELPDYPAVAILGRHFQTERTMTSMSRRHALAGSLFAIPALAGTIAVAQAQDTQAARAEIAETERKHPRRICGSILNIPSGKRVDHRASEPILMCSTFKALAA